MTASAPLIHAPQPSPRQGFALMLALLALVPAGKAILYDTLDPDLFLHLLIAEQITRDGLRPFADPLSYMSIKEPWTPFSWLAELAMKFIWDGGGYRAAVAMHALMGSALICLYALACATRLAGQSNRLLRVLVATAFAAFLSIPFLSFRPVTATLVIMAACVWLLIRDRMAGERTRAVWLLIPLTALLINLHLYAILIPAWLAALLAGALWEAWRGRDLDRAEARRRVVRYATIAFACAIACLATPLLPGVIRSMFTLQFNDAMVGGSFVREYQPFYSGTAGMVSAALVAIALLCIVMRRRELRAGEIFWLLGSIILLLRMGRFSPVFAMAVAPMVAATLPRLSDRALSRPVICIATAVVLGWGLFRVAASLPGPQVTLDQWLNRNGPLMPGYPSSAAAFVEQNVPPRTGRLINEYDWGGYLAWRLGPRFQVLLDGRTNLYAPEFWRKTYLAPTEELGPFLQSLEADVAILPTSGSRFEHALTSAGWTMTWSDGRAVVLVPPENAVRPLVSSN